MFASSFYLSETSSISEERVAEIKEWLKHHSEPEKKVKDLMKDTAPARLKWIRENNGIVVKQVFAEYPRLSLPGMVSKES